MGTPLEVVRWRDDRLSWSQLAEIIIEGEIPPNTFEEEGRPGETSHVYHQVAKRHPVKIKA